MYISVAVILAVVGAIFGSFAGAQVWRLRARQLVEDKAAGEKVDAKELKRLKPLTGKRGRADRSIDLETGTQLAWYDMIPVVSWLMLRGKSRYSGKPIGRMEILLEVGMALFFVVSFVLWPLGVETWQGIALLALWLAAGVGLAILFAYDARWFLLPDKVMWPVVVLGAVSVMIGGTLAIDISAYAASVGGSLLILCGLYLLLYVVSRGKWIGFGDVKLGLALALLLADWQLALLGLFLANLIGTALVLPGMATGKIDRGTHVPFGPLLIVGAVLAKLLGAAIITWYMSLFTL